jgi:uncharacterized protein (UPF0276 family)
VLADNFLAGARPADGLLGALRRDYPMALHSVGISLGSTDPLDRSYLRRLARMADELDVAIVSDHLAWVSVDGLYVHDLLPLPCTAEVVEHLVTRIDRAQTLLRRPLCIENPARYLRFAHDELPLAELLTQLVVRTGCRLLLDLTNAVVSEANVGGCAGTFVDALPVDAIAYIHLAGPSQQPDHLLDAHSGPVPESVWTLYRRALQRFGPRPTLVEWDNEVPDLAVVLEQARRADTIAQEWSI